MKISVVMTTYNGEKYIYEQLESLYRQTRLPDEVIISDDNSKDNTVKIIKDFIAKNQIKDWILLVNEKNKGWQKNFIEAMIQATGDIIFLADQDDIWLNDKIEFMHNIMTRNKEIKCLVGKVITIDGNGSKFNNKRGFLEGNRSDEVKKIYFSEKFNTITLLGCAMCVSKEIVEIIQQINVKKFSHDSQCCRLATIIDGMYIVDRPVIKYRIHNANTSGVDNNINYGSTSIDKRINTIKENIIWLDEIYKYFSANNLPREKMDIILITKKMQEIRYEFLVNKSLLKYIKLFRFKRYYSNKSMLVGDFAYCYGINKIAGKVLWYSKRLKKLIID